jgi:hypothetical protein
VFFETVYVLFNLAVHTLSTVSVVGVATRLRHRRFVIRIPVTVRDFFLDPPIPHFCGNRVFYPRGLGVRGLNLTTRLRLVSRLRMSGAIPLLLLCALMAWTGEAFLGAFAKLRKPAIRFVMSVRSSVGMELGSHWTGFHEICNLSIFDKSVEKIHVSLKSNKNNGYFTCRPIYIFYRISLISS